MAANQNVWSLSPHEDPTEIAAILELKREYILCEFHIEKDLRKIIYDHYERDEDLRESIIEQFKKIHRAKTMEEAKAARAELTIIF